MIMVWTRSQPENLSKEELIDALISLEDLFSKLSDFISRFDNLLRRYEILPLELTVSNNCNRLLSERIVQLEGNAINNAQYHRRESLEINPVPTSIDVDVLSMSIVLNRSWGETLWSSSLSLFDKKGHCDN